MAHEKELSGFSGWLMVLVVLTVGVAAIWTHGELRRAIRPRAVAMRRLLIVAGACPSPASRSSIRTKRRS